MRIMEEWISMMINTDNEDANLGLKANQQSSRCGEYFNRNVN